MADELPDAPWASGKSDLPDAPWVGSEPKTEKPLTASEVGSGVIKNIGPSALQFGKDLVQPFIHPIDTAESLKNLGHGILQKTGIVSGDDHEKYANAVGQFFADRYGGIENVKKTLATDPVGLAGDLSVLLTGGGSLAARAPGLVGKTAEITSKVGQLIDPVTQAANAAKLGYKATTGAIGALGTHTGGESLRVAAKAGYEGGEAAKAFRENLRDIEPMEKTVDAAQTGLTNLRNERSAEYQANMAALSADKNVLDFSTIDNAVNGVYGIKKYKGQDLSPTTQGIRQQMTDAIGEWKNLNPADFHTVEGLDALKQKLGNIRDATAYGTPERVIANNIYHAVRNTIIAQDPKYAKYMKGYEEASKQIKEIQRTLSLPGDHAATIDTSLRKLQSVLRDNVNTSFGRRKELAQVLIDAGAPQLMERLAGQSLKAPFARGIGRIVASELGALGIGVGAAGLPGAAAAAATLPFMSPRLMGEAHYYAGRAATPAKYVNVRPRTAFQVGRAANINEDRLKQDAAMRRALSYGQ